MYTVVAWIVSELLSSDLLKWAVTVVGLYTSVVTCDIWVPVTWLFMNSSSEYNDIVFGYDLDTNDPFWAPYVIKQHGYCGMYKIVAQTISYFRLLFEIIEYSAHWVLVTHVCIYQLGHHWLLSTKPLHEPILNHNAKKVFPEN